MDFNSFDLSLGINVNLVRYLSKQPIRLFAKSQAKNVTFFCIEFDLLDELGRGLACADVDSPASDEIELGPGSDSNLPSSASLDA
jgi:hypothetical protein